MSNNQTMGEDKKKRLIFVKETFTYVHIVHILLARQPPSEPLKNTQNELTVSNKCLVRGLR